jgi:hypothetical protein
MDFAKRSNRNENYKPVLEYDYDKLDIAYKNISRRTKCYVQLSGQKPRDNSMYSFSKSDVKSMTRRLNNFEEVIPFGKTIPNNMDRKRPGSRVSMSNDVVYGERRSNTSLAIPKGLKNSGIFNY